MTYHPNLQPFQGAVPEPQAAPQASTYYAGEGTYALMELKRRCEALILGWLAYKAGKNYYAIHPNVEDSFVHGAHALRRWWVWLFFTKVWLGSAIFLGWTLYLGHHDIRGESFHDATGDLAIVTRNLTIFILPALIAILVTYSRNVDFSLFKRRAVYKVLRPVVVVLDRVPNWILYLIVLCPLFFPFAIGGFDSPDAAVNPASAITQVCSLIAEGNYAIPTALHTAAGVGSDWQAWYEATCP